MKLKKLLKRMFDDDFILIRFLDDCNCSGDELVLVKNAGKWKNWHVWTVRVVYNEDLGSSSPGNVIEVVLC